MVVDEETERVIEFVSETDAVFEAICDIDGLWVNECVAEMDNELEDVLLPVNLADCEKEVDIVPDELNDAEEDVDLVDDTVVEKPHDCVFDGDVDSEPVELGERENVDEAVFVNDTEIVKDEVCERNEVAVMLVETEVEGGLRERDKDGVDVVVVECDPVNEDVPLLEIVVDRVLVQVRCDDEVDE
jgi:hypothetical protein